ncbi:LamG domain-containing protein [bacterium]|nr:LamG domain-containing protein [bacterium]
MTATLVGHWPLAGDTHDVSGNGNHGENRGVDLTASGPDGRDGSAAVFDGRQSAMLVCDSPSLRTGSEDFALAAHIYTEAMVDDPLGDIATKFDPQRRKGFNFGLKRHSAACTSLANYRNLQFGIDDDALDPEWTDCGQPGRSTFVMALAVHEGALYAGTAETAEDHAGHVFRYVGDAQWEDLGPLDGANAVMTLAPYEGALYAGTGRLKLLGSSLPESANSQEGGKVFRRDGDAWVDCGKMGGERGSYAEYAHDTVHSLEVFQGRLYGVPLYTQGLFCYEGDQTWTDCGSYGRRAFTLGAYRGALHLLDNGPGVYRYESGDDWTRWTRLAELSGVSQVYSLAVYQGRMVVGTWPEARVFGAAPDGGWSDMGRLGEELEVMGMAVYNGKLYAGTLPLGQVYRYDGDGRWTCTGQLDTTPDGTYRRAWSTAVYDGKLFFGTLPAGRVMSLEAGRNATMDRALAPGWRHVAAVRRQGKLALYVDGEEVAASSAFADASYDLSHGEPLQVGCGQHDYFNGRIADRRFYRGAPSAEEIRTLAENRSTDG